MEAWAGAVTEVEATEVEALMMAGMVAVAWEVVMKVEAGGAVGGGHGGDMGVDGDTSEVVEGAEDVALAEALVEMDLVVTSWHLW